MEKERLINSFLNDVEIRPTVRNWPEDVKAIVDGYRTFTSISHAVQKDAIQNGWSARKFKKGKGWQFVFELLETKDKKYLLMTDKGTTGLTGRVLTPEEYESDLHSVEKWGRFEGVAFTQPREDKTLGSRGRGKFIFVGASKEYTILYDTLRDDGIYRFGFRTVIKTESPVAAYDNNQGKKKLIEMTKNVIQPLSSIGTRVIIINPVEELIEDIKKGHFLRYIGETWWEIILKHGAIIKVKVGEIEKIASIPEEFNFKIKDSEKYKIWFKKNQKIPINIGKIQVKNLNIAYNNENTIHDNIRGVAIQRSGMKICSIEPKYMGKEIAERLYGYINFEADTEEKLLEDEGIEHYYYDFRRAFPGAIKRFVEDEMMRFAQEKLGYGIDSRELRRQQHRNAERRALIAVNKFANILGIGFGPWVIHNDRPGGERIPKKVHIHMDELLLPHTGDLRVNYGEAVKNIKIKIVNDDILDIHIRVKLFLRFYDKILKVFLECDTKVKSKTTTEAFGPFGEKFVESIYPDKGKYTIVAKIVSLMDEDKGVELDYKTKSFYLEEDPPMRGLFERCEAFNFPDNEPIKYWMGYSEYGSERGLVLYYNSEHPGYSPVSEIEEDLAEYILRIAGQEICRYDLMQEKTILFKDIQKDDPQEILKQERKVVGELIYKFRKGEI